MLLDHSMNLDQCSSRLLLLLDSIVVKSSQMIVTMIDDMWNSTLVDQKNKEYPILPHNVSEIIPMPMLSIGPVTLV